MLETTPACRHPQDDPWPASAYADRPHICRGFDNTGCEVNAPGGSDGLQRRPRAFLDYLKAKRPPRVPDGGEEVPARKRCGEGPVLWRTRYVGYELTWRLLPPATRSRS